MEINIPANSSINLRDNDNNLLTNNAEESEFLR